MCKKILIVSPIICAEIFKLCAKLGIIDIADRKKDEKVKSCLPGDALLALRLAEDENVFDTIVFFDVLTFENTLNQKFDEKLFKNENILRARIIEYVKRHSSTEVFRIFFSDKSENVVFFSPQKEVFNYPLFEKDVDRDEVGE